MNTYGHQAAYQFTPQGQQQRMNPQYQAATNFDPSAYGQFDARQAQGLYAGQYGAVDHNAMQLQQQQQSQQQQQQQPSGAASTSAVDLGAGSATGSAQGSQ